MATRKIKPCSTFKGVNSLYSKVQQGRICEPAFPCIRYLHCLQGSAVLQTSSLETSTTCLNARAVARQVWADVGRFSGQACLNALAPQALVRCASACWDKSVVLGGSLRAKERWGSAAVRTSMVRCEWPCVCTCRFRAIKTVKQMQLFSWSLQASDGIRVIWPQLLPAGWRRQQLYLGGRRFFMLACSI